MRTSAQDTSGKNILDTETIPVYLLKNSRQSSGLPHRARPEIDRTEPTNPIIESDARIDMQKGLKTWNKEPPNPWL